MRSSAMQYGWLLVLCVLAPAAVHGSGQLVDKAVVTGAFEQLMHYYDNTTGYFGNASINWPFWTSGNAYEAVCNYYNYTRDERVPPLIAEIIPKMKLQYTIQWSTLGCDDIQWHALAWLRCFEVGAGGADLVSLAQYIYSALLNDWHAWNTTCPTGGMNWARNIPYRNTITNGQFLTGMARLATLQHTHANAANAAAALIGDRTPLQWALATYEFLATSHLLDPTVNVLQDGMSNQDCAVVGNSDKWTYNQGIWLEGLARMSLLTGNSTFVDLAHTLLNGSFWFYAGADDPKQIAQEKACGPHGWCNGADGRMFKGVLARHAGYFYNYIPASVAAAAPTAVQAPSSGAAVSRAQLKQWLTNQVDSILANDAVVHTATSSSSSFSSSASTIQFGQLWQGPFTPDDTPWISHQSGFDAVLALYSLGL